MRKCCFVLLCFCLFISQAWAVEPLSDAEYEQMLAEEPKFAEAEQKLANQWEKLLALVDGDEKQLLLAEQQKWVAEGRQAEAAYLMLISPDDLPLDSSVREKVGDKLPKHMAYAMASNERAAKLQLLVEQYENTTPSVLSGYLTKVESEYLFTPYPFAVPFTLCDAGQFEQLSSGMQDYLNAQLTLPEPKLIRIKGNFQLPGVYRLDADFYASDQPEGMGWREQDSYLY